LTKKGFFVSAHDINLEFVDPWSNGSDHDGPFLPDAYLIGVWDLDIGIDNLDEALFLFRDERQDLLWAFTSSSSQTMRKCIARRQAGDPEWLSEAITCGCVAGLPRQGNASEAATRLLRVLVVSRVGHAFPRSPWRAGLLSEADLERIVDEVKQEFDRNCKVAEVRQLTDEAPIIRPARQLNLSPRPAGINDRAWEANCPGRGHSLMLGPSTNQFGCGYCRCKGGPIASALFAPGHRSRPGRLM
jgi:hypothetical protein